MIVLEGEAKTREMVASLRDGIAALRAETSSGPGGFPFNLLADMKLDALRELWKHLPENVRAKLWVYGMEKGNRTWAKP
jgi:hypothetical protein